MRSSTPTALALAVGMAAGPLLVHASAYASNVRLEAETSLFDVPAGGFAYAAAYSPESSRVIVWHSGHDLEWEWGKSGPGPGSLDGAGWYVRPRVHVMRDGTGLALWARWSPDGFEVLAELSRPRAAEAVELDIATGLPDAPLLSQIADCGDGRLSIAWLTGEQVWTTRLLAPENESVPQLLGAGSPGSVPSIGCNGLTTAIAWATHRGTALAIEGAKGPWRRVDEPAEGTCVAVLPVDDEVLIASVHSPSQLGLVRLDSSGVVLQRSTIPSDQFQCRTGVGLALSRATPSTVLLVGLAQGLSSGLLYGLTIDLPGLLPHAPPFVIAEESVLDFTLHERADHHVVTWISAAPQRSFRERRVRIEGVLEKPRPAVEVECELKELLAHLADAQPRRLWTTGVSEQSVSRADRPTTARAEPGDECPSPRLSALDRQRLQYLETALDLSALESVSGILQRDQCIDCFRLTLVKNAREIQEPRVLGLRFVYDANGTEGGLHYEWIRNPPSGPPWIVHRAVDEEALSTPLDALTGTIAPGDV